MRITCLLLLVVVIAAVSLTADARLSRSAKARGFLRAVLAARIRRCVNLKKRGVCQKAKNFRTKFACYRCRRLFKKIMIGCFRLHKSGLCKKSKKYAYACGKCKQLGKAIRAYIVKRVNQCKKMKSTCQKQFKAKKPSRGCRRCLRLFIGIKVVQCLKKKFKSASCKKLAKKIRAFHKKLRKSCIKALKSCKKNKKGSKKCRFCARYMIRQLKRAVRVCKFLYFSGRCSKSKYKKFCGKCKRLGQKLKKFIKKAVTKCLKLAKSKKCRSKKYRRPCMRCRIFLGRLRAYVIRSCMKLRRSGKCKNKRFAKPCKGCAKVAAHFRKVIRKRVAACKKLKSKCKSRAKGYKGKCIRCAIFLRRLTKFVARRCVFFYASGKCDGKKFKANKACGKCHKFFAYLGKKIRRAVKTCKAKRKTCKGKKTFVCRACRRLRAKLSFVGRVICRKIKKNGCPKSGKQATVCNKFNSKVCKKMKRKN